ncbi:hypothetical protein M422DRAFT_253106 [Sphaerobolus stellatus SS14]|uniref:Cytochrome P450 n=1 Tax=Sphaerobolus stellatus (strain SS14) TaxID=990650 RepID=A0A0C9VXE9_SPHS4|nr:hypothetical protein M422DRAFT_253106 [Sphaerobolus stellatus SS14]
MSSITSLVVLVILTRLLYGWHKYRSRVIANLKGPASASWLVGCFGEWVRTEEIGEKDFAWVKEYGESFRMRGPLGNDFFFTVDPKAIQYIFNTASYNFPKPPETRLSVALATGKGLAWAEGEQHARQRKIMNPGFSYGALRGFLPLFRATAQKTIAKLRELAPSGSRVIDIHPWMARTTLDAILVAAFDFQFNSVESPGGNELSRTYNNLFADAFFQRSDGIIAMEALCAYLPQFCIDMMRNLPDKQMTRLRNYMKVAREVAQSILDTQTKNFEDGKEGSKDVMSILIRANLTEDPKKRLDDEEILSQLTTINLAGHETTANMLTWALYELARHPDFQTEIRDEIKSTREKATSRENPELSVADLDSMKLMETLRYHPIVTALVRAADRDDNVPLLYPITTKTGEVLHSVPFTKGQRVIISIAAYQRLKSVWGEDADEWRPKRFLEGVERLQSTSLGVMSNMGSATFSSGVRSCIGWRFAMIEMQAILIELVENFEWSPAPGVEILRAPAGLMSPM